MDWKKATAFLALAGLVALAGCGSKDDDEGFGQGGGGNNNTTSTASTAALGTGSITGKITLKGKAPTASVIAMDADPVCKTAHSGAVKDESVVADAKGNLANVFVYVKDGANSYPAPASAVTLTQKGCMYTPHVFGIQVNQPLEIVNGDPTLHNVHCMATINDPFNVGQPTQGMATEKKFSKPEVLVKFKCDVHSWMHCCAGVVTNPFYSVSGMDGTYKISQLPAGTYTLVAVHEKYGESAPQTVTLTNAGTQTVDFTFNAQ